MTDKVCVIVGAGPGIGLAIARRFAREGYKIALIARRVEMLNEYVSDLKKDGFTGNAFAADTSDPSAVRRVFSEIKEQMGAPEVLIYNAARRGQPAGIVSALDFDLLCDDFKVNVAGALVCAQQVLTSMRAERHGTLLFTGSGLALNANPNYASLAIGKAGLRNLSFSLAMELESDGIHVAIVTISGYVHPDSPLEPEVVAEEYWKLHVQQPGHFDREIVVK